MDLGTVPDWLSLLVNGAVAVAALVGLAHARQDARRAERRSEAAQQELAADRARRESTRRAHADLENITEILRLHGARTSEHIVLNPAEVGRIRTALALLPPGVTPRTRALYDAGRTGSRPSLDEVSQELEAEARSLSEQSVSPA